MFVAHDEETSVQFKEVDSRHLTSVTPCRSAMGLENILIGALQGLGMGATPASQLAQCQATGLLMVATRRMNDFGFPKN